jgi:hypothetical protein
VGVSNTQGAFRNRLEGGRLVHMRNPREHKTAITRRLDMTDRHSSHASQVRSMQRGLRGLAARGISARPTALRLAYSPHRP